MCLKGLFINFEYISFFSCPTERNIFYKRFISIKPLWLEIIEKKGCTKSVCVIYIIYIIVLGRTDFVHPLFSIISYCYLFSATTRRKSEKSDDKSLNNGMPRPATRIYLLIEQFSNFKMLKRIKFLCLPVFKRYVYREMWILTLFRHQATWLSAWKSFARTSKSIYKIIV